MNNMQEAREAIEGILACSRTSGKHLGMVSERKRITEEILTLKYPTGEPMIAVLAKDQTFEESTWQKDVVAVKKYPNDVRRIVKG